MFEVGSGTGRDAFWLRENGWNVQCSDASATFVALLRDTGIPAQQFNLLEDPFPEGSCSAVLANAVLLHFTRDEFRRAVRKVWEALPDGGVFAFTVKEGEGEGWSTAKMGEPRFFTYWGERDLGEAVRDAGFAHVDVEKVLRERGSRLWVVAHK